VFRQAVWNHNLPSNVCEALGSFGCRVGLYGGFYTALGGGFKTMTCWGPFTSCSFYWGNTWPLKVVA